MRPNGGLPQSRLHRHLQLSPRLSQTPRQDRDAPTSAVLLRPAVDAARTVPTAASLEHPWRSHRQSTDILLQPLPPLDGLNDAAPGPVVLLAPSSTPLSRCRGHVDSCVICPRTLNIIGRMGYTESLARCCQRGQGSHRHSWLLVTSHNWRHWPRHLPRLFHVPVWRQVYLTRSPFLAIGLPSCVDKSAVSDWKT